MCYATASLEALWLLDLARTKTTSVDGRVKEVVGNIVTGIATGPGAMLCTIWGEREDALGRLRRRRGSELIQSWVKMGVAMGQTTCGIFRRKQNAPFGTDVC